MEAVKILGSATAKDSPASSVRNVQRGYFGRRGEAVAVSAERPIPIALRMSHDRDVLLA